MSTNEAQNLLGFDEADLGANRLGQLTDKQKNFLAGEHKTQQSVFVGVGIAIAFIFCCLPVFVAGGRVLPQFLVN